MTDHSNYTVSIHYDRRLYRHDIAGSIVHTRMLAKQGIIAEGDADQIIQGLEKVREEIQAERFPWDPALEDIHMNIESRLQQLIGPVAGRLHTGRSRNDQIALDMRLYTKEVIGDTVKGLRAMQQALVDLAGRYPEVVMPGYTHLQRAQPVLFAHHLLSYFQMSQRDVDRFRDCYRRTDLLPLGSGALAGVAYPADREFLARELGFGGVTANSMDAVSDRDFVLESLSAASIFPFMYATSFLRQGEPLPPKISICLSLGMAQRVLSPPGKMSKSCLPAAKGTVWSASPCTTSRGTPVSAGTPFSGPI